LLSIHYLIGLISLSIHTSKEDSFHVLSPDRCTKSFSV